MFQVLGGSLSIGKAWESLEQLVAPIPEDDSKENDDNEDENDFESAILQHIVSKRQEFESDTAGRQIDAVDTVPDSPSSLATIALDEEDATENNSFFTNKNEAFSKPVHKLEPVQSSSSAVFLSNAELEKSIQARYREQLENEVQRFEKRIRQQKESFEAILSNVQQERDEYMRKASSLEENVRYMDNQEEMAELQIMMKDLSAKLHTTLEDKAILEENCKTFQRDVVLLQSQVSELTFSQQNQESEVNPLALSLEEQSQLIEELNKQLQLSKEELEQQKSTIKILSQENETLVMEISDKDLEIHKLQSQTSFFDGNNEQNSHNSNTNILQKQLFEESERANDALRAELSSLKLEYTTATIAWERAKAAMEKELASHSYQEEVSRFKAEIERLESALTESEHLLKEAEDVAWKHKAEAAEILYAYQSDEQKWQQEKKYFEMLENDWKRISQNQQEQQQQQVANSCIEQTTEGSSVSNKTSDNIAAAAPTAVSETVLLEQFLAQLVRELSSLIKAPSVPNVTTQTIVLPKTESMLSPDVTQALRDILAQLLVAHASMQPLQQKLDQATKESNEQIAAVQKIAKAIQDMTKLCTAEPTSASNLTDRFTLDDLSSMLAHLRKQYETTLQIHSGQEKACQTELVRVKAELTLLQEQQQRNIHTTTEQLQETRAKLSGAEDENRKLHQVIAQLRSLRRAKDGEEQSAQQELQHLRNVQQQLTKENEQVKLRIRELEHVETQYLHFKTQYEETLQTKTQLEDTLTETKRYLAVKEKQCYDQLTSLDVLQAEQRLLQQEIALRIQEIDNLNDALAHIDHEHAGQIQSLRRQIQDTEASKEEYAKAVAAQQAEGWKKSLIDVQKHAQQLTRQLEDQDILHRQEQMQYHQEKQNMQRSLENVVQRLQNSSQDVIDRTLMANLLVQYFQRKKSKEVLHLIARMLNLNEEQLIIIGLRGAPVDIVNTLLTTVIGQTTPVQVEGDNLAELWVNYLINQASADEREAMVARAQGMRANKAQQQEQASSSGTGSVPSTPRSSHSSKSANYTTATPGMFPLTTTTTTPTGASSSSNFHSLPASPATQRSPDTTSSSTPSPSSSSAAAADNKPPSLQFPKTTGPNAPGDVPPEDIPLGGFLGAATSLLGFWRR